MAHKPQPTLSCPTRPTRHAGRRPRLGRDALRHERLCRHPRTRNPDSTSGGVRRSSAFKGLRVARLDRPRPPVRQRGPGAVGPALAQTPSECRRSSPVRSPWLCRRHRGTGEIQKSIRPTVVLPKQAHLPLTVSTLGQNRP